MVIRFSKKKNSETVKDKYLARVIFYQLLTQLNLFLANTYLLNL